MATAKESIKAKNAEKIKDLRARNLQIINRFIFALDDLEDVLEEIYPSPVGDEFNGIVERAFSFTENLSLEARLFALRQNFKRGTT